MRSPAVLVAALCVLLTVEGKAAVKRNSQPQGAAACETLPASDSVPTSVHRLRPADVKVIGSMGDSLTAAMAANAPNFFGVMVQNRGLSWSGGGQDYGDHITMPNMIKQYNPDVHGFAIGDGTETSDNSVFNVAVVGSTSQDLPRQANEIVQRMKDDPDVDIDNDWKVITIMTGNNDLCDYCNVLLKIEVDEYTANLQAALDILQAELPRTYVNLVEPVNMEIVREVDVNVMCSTFHALVCGCAAFPASEQAIQDLYAEGDKFQVAVETIAGSGRYDTSDDFTVVAQVFFNQTFTPYTATGSPDMTYFAPDCFHFSVKGQQAAGTALWNSMISVPSEKQLEWATDGVLKCPTEEHPYFYTNLNTDL